MYKDYAGNHKIDMYAELINCIETGKMGEYPGQEYFNIRSERASM